MACTATAVANGTEMCRAAGSSSARTGRCGSATTTTSDLAGSGADSSEWADTYIATVSTGAGLASSGSRYEPTGTCTAGTTTTIVCMAAPSASGVATGALVFTATVIEPCTATIKAIGARFVPAVTCGSATTTTEQTSGSGDAIVESADTCNDYPLATDLDWILISILGLIRGSVLYGPRGSPGDPTQVIMTTG